MTTDEIEMSGLFTDEIHRLSLAKRYLTVRRMLEAKSVDSTIRRSGVAGALVAELQAYVVGNMIHKDRSKFHSFDVPVNRWDHFKHALGPVWTKTLGRWFPARYETRYEEYKTEYIHICPHVDAIGYDGRRAHIEFLTPPDIGLAREVP